MTEEQKENNCAKSKVRCRIEHIFGEQKMRMKDETLRSMVLRGQNNESKHGLSTIMYESKLIVEKMLEDQKPSIFIVTAQAPIDLFTQSFQSELHVVKNNKQKYKKHNRQIKFLHKYFLNESLFELEDGDISDETKKDIIHNTCPFAAIVESIEEMELPLNYCFANTCNCYNIFLKKKIFWVTTYKEF